MSPAVRIRRTPDQAKSFILETASQRLAKHGIKGLNIKDIADDAGINHATVLHHFGSAERMRYALNKLMMKRLGSEMSSILNSDHSPEFVFEALFNLMSQSGHIKLLAWRAMEDFGGEGAAEQDKKDHMAEGSLFEEITNKVLDQLEHRDPVLARNLIFLAFSSAVGWGLTGSAFRGILGLSSDQIDKFPAWVGAQMPKLMEPD